MYALQPIVTANFTHAGHNMGDTAADADAQVFAREATIDTQIGATVADKDKPHLTLNDKVFAARYALAGEVGPAVVLGDNGDNDDNGDNGDNGDDQ